MKYKLSIWGIVVPACEWVDSSPRPLLVWLTCGVGIGIGIGELVVRALRG